MVIRVYTGITVTAPDKAQLAIMFKMVWQLYKGAINNFTCVQKNTCR